MAEDRRGFFKKLFVRGGVAAVGPSLVKGMRAPQPVKVISPDLLMYGDGKIISREKTLEYASTSTVDFVMLPPGVNYGR